MSKVLINALSIVSEVKILTDDLLLLHYHEHEELR